MLVFSLYLSLPPLFVFAKCLLSCGSFFTSCASYASFVLCSALDLTAFGSVFAVPFALRLLRVLPWRTLDWQTAGQTLRVLTPCARLQTTSLQLARLFCFFCYDGFLRLGLV